ncbi:hypothetical protein AB0L40_21895 [Patulibacter sp. NPDC049589]|uniref:hypothetical protein n=1 Tax=Patulibacter sp. NPDC049589 TaxID=3154731 RepID=UPI00343B766A
MIVVAIVGVLLVLYGLARVFDVGGLSTRTQERAQRIEQARRAQGGAPQEVPQDLARWLGYAFTVLGVVLVLVGLLAG